MSREHEEDMIGEENHLVPQLEPEEYCNAKKSVTIHYGKFDESTEYIDDDLLETIKEKHDVESRKGDQENRTYFKGYCNAEAGKGTDHLGSGRCQHHGGSNPGAPKHNQNSRKHATTVDPHHYAENLPLEEEEWIDDTTASILDRVRRIHGREPDFLDRTMARSIAINFHILSKARDYSKDELVQVIVHDGSSHEEKGALVEEVRRFQNSIIQNLRQLGLLEDPESKKANSLDSWREFVAAGGQKAPDGSD